MVQEPLRAQPDITSQDIVRALLEDTNHTKPPTNADAIAKHLGLYIVNFRPEEFNLDSRIRAFLWPSKFLIGVDSKLDLKRRTFSLLHEIGHFVLPGHTTYLKGDEKITDEDGSFGPTSVILQEIEANQFAADCLFQLDRFDELVYVKGLNWNSVREIADIFQASYEATARRWVENSFEDCALVVFKPTSLQKVNPPLQILYTITSKTFRDNYFASLLPGQTMSADSVMHRFFYGHENKDNGVLRVDLSSEITEFSMTLFSNSYRLFGLLKPTLQ